MRLIKTILNYLDNGADKYLQSLSSEKSNRRPNVAYGQTNYYVSNTGSDSNDGLTTATAWQTLTLTFNACVGVTSAVPTLWVSYPSVTHTSSFTGDTNASNYASIPTGWK